MEGLLNSLKKLGFADKIKKQRASRMKGLPPTRLSTRVRTQPKFFKAAPGTGLASATRKSKRTYTKRTPTVAAAKSKSVSPKDNKRKRAAASNSKSVSPKAKRASTAAEPNVKKNYSSSELKNIINTIKKIYKYHPTIRDPALFDSIEAKLNSSMDKDEAFKNIILYSGLYNNKNPAYIIIRYNSGNSELKKNMRKNLLHTFLYKLLKECGSKSKSSKSKSKSSSNQLNKLFKSLKLGGKSIKTLKLMSMYNKML